MANQLNTGSLDTLKQGDTLLVDARQVNGGKVQLEFAEIISTTSTNKGVNLLGLINKSDDRFSSNARRAWMTGEPSDIGDAFGIDLGANAAWYASEKGEMLELNVLNPIVQDLRCRVIVTETITPDEYQEANIEKKAKRKGKEGPFITHNGNYIFSNTDVQLTNADTKEWHTFLEPDTVGANAKMAEPSQAFDSEIGI